MNDQTPDDVDVGKAMLGFVEKTRAGSWSVPETNFKICSRETFPLHPLAASRVYFEKVA